MPIQYCLWIDINGWQEGVWCFVPLEGQQGYHDVVSPLLAEFSISSIDFLPAQRWAAWEEIASKSAEDTVPAECDFEGSFPLQSACSQISVHRDSPCARTAVHLALVGQACVDGANYKEKFTWGRLEDTQSHVTKQWDWSLKPWFIPACCPHCGRCQGSLWVSAFQLRKVQTPSFPSAFCLGYCFSLLSSLQCSCTMYLLLSTTSGKATCGETWDIGNSQHKVADCSGKAALSCTLPKGTITSLWCCWHGRPSAKNYYFQTKLLSVLIWLFKEC